MPKFSYFIAPHDMPLSSASDAWHRPLPLARPTSGESAELVVSHGEYFEAVRTFVELDDFKIFAGVMAGLLQQTIEASEIQHIRIYLEKHGEFYHPARLETDLAGRTFHFVLNVAISDTGRNILSREFYNLKRLNAEFPGSYLPRVYTMAEVAAGKRKAFSMFMGEWFHDHHEFHISTDASDSRLKICVWDEKNGHFYLTDQQTAALIRQAAGIMTDYYNVATFEHISPWHHAAGDFIVKIDKDAVGLKLITVRNYAPLFRRLENQNSDRGDDVEYILQALLIYFLKLSIKMRLDRLDGVGDIVWLDEIVVKNTVLGVFGSLAKKPPLSILPDALDVCFKHYLSVYRQEDLLEFSETILPTLGSTPPEIQIIKENLADHAHSLIESIDEI